MVRSASLGVSRTFGEWSVERDLAGSQASPERYEENPQHHDERGEQARLRSEGTTSPELGACLLCGDERCAERSEAAHGETVDGALEKVPGNMQPYGYRQLARDHVPEAEHQAGEDYVERADDRGIRVVGVQ